MSGLIGYSGAPVTIISGAGEANAKEWRFDNLGKITLPLGGDIVNNDGLSLLATDTSVRKTQSEIPVGDSAVVWSGYDSTVSSARLLVQVECEVTGDPSGPHTQSCEIIVASRGDQFEPAISVYGVVYTSVSQLVTFTAQRNVITNKVDIVGSDAGNASTNPLLRIYSVEQLSRI